MKKYLLFIIYTFTHMICHGQASHFVASGEVNIHFKTFGSGHPILIINGGPGFNSNGFSSLANKIENLGYKAILFDQRGTGLSELSKVDSSTITMDLMVKDIESIRKELQLKEWTVLGHSFGGILANYYTAKHPENVSAMIQSSSGGIDLSLLETAQESIYSKFSEGEIDSLNSWRREYRNNGSLLARKKYNQLLAKAYVYHESLIPIIADRLMEGDLALNRLVWDNLISIQYDSKLELSKFCKPVLIIQGKQDIVSEELAFKADSIYCNSRISFLDNSGHYGWLDQEKKYLQEIASFLRFVYPQDCDDKKSTPSQFGKEIFEDNVYRGSFSQSDSTFYFFKKIGLGSEDYRIYSSKIINGTWSDPKQVILGEESSDLYPSITRDGNRMMFVSYRPIPDSLQKNASPNAYLWYVNRKNGDWGVPIFPEKINKLGHYHSWAEFGWNDNIFFRRTSPDWKTNKTYYSEWDSGEYSQPILFEEVEQWLNWSDSIKVVGGSPGPSKNLIFLDVATIDNETGRNSSDIWISKKKDLNWSIPAPLSENINQSGYDVFPFFSSDGYTLYFVRDFENFFKVSMNCIEDTR